MMNDEENEPEGSIVDVSLPSTPSPEAPEARFNTVRRKEIQEKIDQNLCLIETSDEGNVNRVILNGKTLARQCNFCKCLFSNKTGSARKNHVEKCAARTLNQTNYNMSMEEKKQFSMMLAELIAMDSKSFSTTQTSSFKNLVEYCLKLGFKVGRHLPQFNVPTDIIPTRNTIKNHMNQEVIRVVEQFKEHLSLNPNFRCAIILDFTTLKYNYCGIVLHFMHKWQLKTVLVSVIDCTGISATSVNIERIAREALLEYGIVWNDNFIITDEGANVVAAFDSDTSAVCIPHTMNTILKRTCDPYKSTGRNQIPGIGIDDITRAKVAGFNGLIKKLKVVINSVKHSYKNYSMLEHPLVTDCDTRWLSKLSMIESWLNLHDNDREVLRHGDLQNFVLVMGIFRPLLRLLESDLLIFKSFKLSDLF